MTPKRFWVSVAVGIALCLMAAGLGVVCGMLTGCMQGVHAQSLTSCAQSGNVPDVLTQTWVIGNPPASVTPGIYVVNLTDGEAEIAGVTLDGTGPREQLTIPVEAANLPANGIGVSTIATSAGLVQLGCPAIVP